MSNIHFRIFCCDALLCIESLWDFIVELVALLEPPLMLWRVVSNMLELFSENVDVFVVDVWSMDAFNDRLLLFLLSFMSFSLLTLLLIVVLSFDGDDVVLIVLVSIIAWRDGNDMLRIFSSCLRSKKKKNVSTIDLQHCALHKPLASSINRCKLICICSFSSISISSIAFFSYAWLSIASKPDTLSLTTRFVRSRSSFFCSSSRM